MWKLLYQLGIYLLSLVYCIAALFNRKAKSFVRGRKNIFKDLADEFEGNTQSTIWIHAASLGEFEQGRPLIEHLKKEFPNLKILLSFFSPSGYEVRKNYPLADYICYLPWDTRSNARKWLSITKPKLAIFIKYEFWSNYINTLYENKIPVISVSTILRPEQIYFQWHGKYFRDTLKKINHFFVQNSESAELLSSIDIHEHTLVGDTRFDRVKDILEQAEELPSLAKFKNYRKLLVAGSIWKEDMEVLNPFINLHREDWCFVIAPHEIEENFLRKIEEEIDDEVLRYSNIEKNVQIENHKVILIDNIGMLAKIYRYADFAYIGGAFGAGLHNILEASCNGIPVFFGDKNFQKFKEAMDLIKLDAAFPVNGFENFKQLLDYLQDEKAYKLLHEVAINYVNQNLGATEKIMNYCRNIISKS
ncbi:MAG TPA: glycosyltransferase N-terminal domain-containing protein [Cyclobacteriaceae bacterium]|nr:glycosyltransferase N-terminal domain-containing protein [Cyclobacteriaceae bacterium]